MGRSIVMGKVYEHIDEKLTKWVSEQHLFFVSTAPLSEDGLINCSPKGLDSFRILGPNQVAYLDLTGSGIETLAHLKENGRIVIMFCAFKGGPNIVRFHGKGEAVTPGEPGFDELMAHFPEMGGVRSIIKIDVTRISDSCGYAVPRYEYVEDRDTLLRWAEKKGEEGVADYQRTTNAKSLDGLPGI